MGIEDAAVQDNPVAQRFEMDTSAGLVVANYRWDGDLLVIFHTEVPSELRGEGLGETFVRDVLDHVRQRNIKIVPLCWFVQEFIARNPHYRDVLASS